MRPAAFLLLLAGCDVDWVGDEILQVPVHVVNQPLVLSNDTLEPVLWRFGARGSYSTAAGETLPVYLECAEGQLLCFETLPQHVFPTMCPPCGRGAVILRASP